MLAGIVVLAVWLAHAQAMSFVHPRRIPPGRTPGDLGMTDWEEVRFPTPDGLELAAWFVPPAPEGDGATLIFLHGARNNRAEMLAQAAMLHRHQYGALLPDMRAHGESEGTLSTLGYAEVEDLRGAVAYLQTRPEVNRERIGVVGHSMGGAVAIRGAARIPAIRAVVAQSAYTSVEDNVASGILLEGASALNICGNTFSNLSTKALTLEGNPSKQIIFSGNLMINTEGGFEGLLDSRTEGNLSIE